MSPENWCLNGVDALSSRAGFLVLSSGVSNARRMISLRNSNGEKQAVVPQVFLGVACGLGREVSRVV